MEKTQNKYEQEALINYCVNREIIKPKTNILTAIKYLFVLEFSTLIIAFFTSYLLVLFGFNYTFNLLHILISTLLIVVFFKKYMILLIELYQHYASIQTRRKCTLKPSCSEYAIIALNKYGIFKASKKIYIRLFITCKGIYQIDYP